MLFNHTLLFAAAVLLTVPATAVAGAHRPTPRTAAAAERNNETAAPSFSRHVRDARLITDVLADALLLSTAQRHAVARCTVAQREALVLAATPADAAQAQYSYLMALRHVLAATQLESYAVLCRQLAGTMLPLDGTELAAR